MKNEKIILADEAAVRFLAAVDELNKRMKKTHSLRIANSLLMFGCKETGAVRRASMDLSRALAELRKP